LDEVFCEVDTYDAAGCANGFGGGNRGSAGAATDIENISTVAQRGFLNAAAANAVPKGKCGSIEAICGCVVC